VTFRGVALLGSTIAWAAASAHAGTVAGFVVNSTLDEPDAGVSRDGVCAATPSGACTLRAAIEEANATAGTFITFGIPGGGVQTIVLGSALPAITQGSVLVDGYTQPGASANTTTSFQALDTSLTVEVTGNDVDPCFSVRASDVIIRGLVINHCAIGIDVANPHGTSTSGVIIQGNFIGTDPTGLIDEGNQIGIGTTLVQDGSVTLAVGGSGPAPRNLISGNGTGITFLTDVDGSVFATIENNMMGPDPTGDVAIAGGTAIILGSGDSTVLRNVISGNDEGVVAHGSGTKTIQGNLIGRSVSGDLLGNDGDGIRLEDGASALVGGPTHVDGNVIVGNAGTGIRNTNLSTGTLTAERNQIADNGALAIDLGPLDFTINDTLDADAFQNFPVLDGVAFTGGTSVSGTLSSTPNTTFRVEVFANAACDPSGFGEGGTFLAANDSVTTDTNGDSIFGVTFPSAIGPTVLTATATAVGHGTSELSPCTPEPPPTTTSTSTTSTTSSTESPTSTTSSSLASTTVTTTSSTSAAPSTGVPTTTAPAPTTTTTTLAPEPCDDVAVDSTLASIACQLEALADRVAGEGALATVQVKLSQSLDAALTRTAQATEACAAGDAKQAKARLKLVQKALAQYRKRLQAAKKKVDPGVRTDFAAAGAAIKTNVQARRASLACPADAPSPR
jgi:CSLREA domain-containing protein